MTAARAQTIGVIGLGAMGWPMAGHLHRAGHAVLGRDIDAERRGGFAREHGTGEPAALADLARASVILTMLPNGAVVRDAIAGGGDSSLANTLARGSVVLDTSSSVPSGTGELGELLARRGIDMVDAGVSGAVVARNPPTSYSWSAATTPPLPRPPDPRTAWQAHVLSRTAWRRPYDEGDEQARVCGRVCGGLRGGDRRPARRA